MATILVVDDSDNLRAQVREILTQADLGVQVIEARNGVEALPLALSGTVDIVLSDIVMPDLDGIGLLRAIRQQKDVEVLPVILVTSQTEQGPRDLGFEVGANDYLTRPFSPTELVTRVQVQMRLLTLQVELQRANERFRRLSGLDDLTGLANRRHFLEESHRELSRCRRHKLALTICSVDIDRLREINNRVGHRAGDALITEVSDVIRRQLRQADTMARFTGGKFALLLPHTDVPQGRQASERVCQAVAATAFPGHATGQITVTIGSASYPDGSIESVEELLNTAERNLDRAKAGGGGQIIAPAPTDGSKG